MSLAGGASASIATGGIATQNTAPVILAGGNLGRQLGDFLCLREGKWPEHAAYGLLPDTEGAATEAAADEVVADEAVADEAAAAVEGGGRGGCGGGCGGCGGGCCLWIAGVRVC